MDHPQSASKSRPLHDGFSLCSESRVGRRGIDSSSLSGKIEDKKHMYNFFTCQLLIFVHVMKSELEKEYHTVNCCIIETTV